MKGIIEYTIIVVLGIISAFIVGSWTSDLITETFGVIVSVLAVVS